MRTRIGSAGCRQDNSARIRGGLESSLFKALPDLCDLRSVRLDNKADFERLCS